MRQKGFTQIIIVIISLFLVAGGLYYYGFRQMSVDQSSSNSDNLILPEPTNGLTANWESYASTQFKYSFKYPATWVLQTFNESDKNILVGSNSLQNYSPVEIEKYMDHGLVNWSGYLGEKPAIKIDFAVYSKLPGPNQYQDKNQFLDAVLNKTSKKQNTSDLIVGGIATEQYKASEDLGPTDVPEVNTYIAIYPDGRIFYMNLLFWNIESFEQLKKTAEWSELYQILSTFKFLQ